MANVNTLKAAEGGRGNPSKKPYMVEVEIDLAAAATAKGSALAAADTIECITVGANTAVMFAGAEITVAPTGGSGATFDLGITGGDVDRYVDGDTNATGFSAPTATARTIVASADTLDVLVLSAAAAAGKIRVFAVLCDVSGIDETDRNTSTQQDTAV